MSGREAATQTYTLYIVYCKYGIPIWPLVKPARLSWVLGLVLTWLSHINTSQPSRFACAICERACWRTSRIHFYYTPKSVSQPAKSATAQTAAPQNTRVNPFSYFVCVCDDERELLLTKQRKHSSANSHTRRDQTKFEDMWIILLLLVFYHQRTTSIYIYIYNSIPFIASRSAFFATWWIEYVYFF